MAQKWVILFILCTDVPSNHDECSADLKMRVEVEDPSFATSLQEGRWVPLAILCEDDLDLEAGFLHCVAGDSALSASGILPIVLEAQVKD
jgi:hypothetical protein